MFLLATFNMTSLVYGAKLAFKFVSVWFIIKLIGLPSVEMVAYTKPISPASDVT